MSNDTDGVWKNALSSMIAFLQTPHGEIDLLRWLREKESALDDNTPKNVVAALKAVPIDHSAFGPQLRETLILLSRNVATPQLSHKREK